MNWAHFFKEGLVLLALSAGVFLVIVWYAMFENFLEQRRKEKEEERKERAYFRSLK